MGMFDDLIPQEATPQRSGMFDDLIPDKKKDTEPITGSFFPGANERIAVLLGFPGDVSEMIMRFAGNTLGFPVGKSPIGSEAIKSGMKAVGINTTPDESTRLNRNMARLGRGIGGGALFGPAGVIPGIGGEFAADAAGDLAKRGGAGPGVETAAETVGGIVGGITAGGAANLASKAVNAMRGTGTPLLEAMKQEKVTPRMAGDVSGSKAAQSTTAALANAPLTGGRIQTAARQTMDEIGAAADRRASQYGAGVSPTDAGTAIEGGLVAYGNQVKATAEAMYQRLHKLVPSDMPVAPTFALKATSELTETLKGMPETAKLLTPSLFKTVVDDLTPQAAKTKTVPTGILDEFGKPIAKTVVTAAAKTGQVPFATVSRLRTEIGGRLADPMMVDDITRGEAKHLYRSLTADMLAAAKTRGPEAVKQLQASHAYYNEQMKFIEKAFKNATSNGRTPEKLFEWATAEGKSGATRLAALRKAMGEEEFGVVSSVVMRRLGQAGADTQFDASTFIRNWDRLDPKAKSVLFGGQGDLADSIDRIAAIARAHTQTSAMVNTSRTAGTAELLRMIGGLSSAVLRAGGAAVGATAGGSVGAAAAGPPGAAVGALIGAATAVGGAILGQWTASKLLTNPAFARWLATPIGPNEIPKHLSALVGVANANADIAVEVGAFLQAISEQQ